MPPPAEGRKVSRRPVWSCKESIRPDAASCGQQAPAKARVSLFFRYCTPNPYPLGGILPRSANRFPGRGMIRHPVAPPRVQNTFCPDKTP